MHKFLITSSGATRVMRVASLVLCLAWGAAFSQEVTFEPLINARSVTSLVEVEDRIFGGLDEGGLVYWDSQDPDHYTRILAGRDLSGNLVSDMAWTGRYLWVATGDGGLTRIDDPSGDMTFRQFSNNLGGFDLTAVTGTIIGGGERVFYAMDGAGIGRITDGIPGNIYNAGQDGLIDDNVNALQFFQDDLFVATPSGISRFANNSFTDQNAGLTNLVINDLAVTESGDLLAAGNGGVFQWDTGSETWSLIGATNNWAVSITSGPAGTFALGVTSGGVGVLNEYDNPGWTTEPLPYSRCFSVYSGDELLAGGRVVEPGMAGAVGYGWLGRMDNGGNFTTWRLDASLVRNADGVTFGADSSPWVGSRNADALSRKIDGAWQSIYEVASAENDSSGLFNQGSPVLSMTRGTDGIVYAGQYSWGTVRYDPVADRSELMYPANCGLAGGHIVNMITHPAGPIIFMHDWANPNKVEVLADPDHWRNSSNWVVLPTGDGGLGTGPGVWDAVVERNDVIWFAVEEAGLVRWDVNGESLGPDDELTWLDTSDDTWYEPVTEFPGISNDPTIPQVALARAADGSIWVGGNGLVRFNYSVNSGTVLVREFFNEKVSPFAEGLISGNVSDVVVDGDNEVWVATISGLNRGTTVDDETTFAAFFDLGNYLSNSSYGTLYSQEAIVPLSGGQYRKITVDPTGEKLLLSSDRGAVLVEPGNPVIDPDAGAGSAAYLYPNPFKPTEGDGSLKLDGIDADAVNGTPAIVEVYNLDGQMVFKSEHVSAEIGFWDGRNHAVGRQPVASGMYVVRIIYKGNISVQPLAVLR